MVEAGNFLNKIIPSEGRSPRGIVKINDIKVPFITAEFDETNYYLAGTFMVQIAISDLPKSIPLSYFSSTPAILIEILAGFPSNPFLPYEAELDQMFVGQVADVQPSLLTNTLRLSGRDLTAKFIDNKTTEKFQNHTSSQIAEILGARRGLKVDADKTETTVGKYYQIDHVRLTDQSSEWDLLTFLAKEENFNVYVKGKTLYFKKITKETEKPYLIHYEKNPVTGVASSNAVDIKLSRNLTIAKDVIVKVVSWNKKQKKPFTVTVKATHNKNTVLAGAAQPIGDAQVFSYRFANLTKQQALERAQKILREISRHEMNLSVKLPADNILSNKNVIKLEGTQTNFDQIYYPAHIVRTLSEEGYTMSVEAKNHQPNTETVL